jgi:hypothetical protein
MTVTFDGGCDVMQNSGNNHQVNRAIGQRVAEVVSP